MENSWLFSESWLHKFYFDNNGTVPSIKDLPLNDIELLRLTSYHKGKNYTTALYEEIAAHPNTNEHIKRSLLILSNYDNSVINAIVTSGNISEELLQELLLRSGREQDKLHIRLALFMKKFKGSDAVQQNQLLSKILDDSDYSVAARYLVAASRETDMNLLRNLSDDEYEHIANAAKNSLNN